MAAGTYSGNIRMTPSGGTRGQYSGEPDDYRAGRGFRHAHFADL